MLRTRARAQHMGKRAYLKNGISELSLDIKSHQFFYTSIDEGLMSVLRCYILNFARNSSEFVGFYTVMVIAHAFKCIAKALRNVELLYQFENFPNRRGFTVKATGSVTSWTNGVKFKTAPIFLRSSLCCHAMHSLDQWFPTYFKWRNL